MLVILPLYILREAGKALGTTMLVFTFLMLLISSGTVMLDGVGIVTVIKVLPYLFPLISSTVVPVAIIAGMLICYGRLAGSNQIIAAQVGGVHPLWLAAPTIAAALLASFITVFLNASPLTESVKSIKRIIFSDRAAIMKRQIKRRSLIIPLQSEQVISVTRFPRQWDERGRLAMDAVVYETANLDDESPDDDDLWDKRYPWPRHRFLARHHDIDLKIDEEKELYIEGSCQDSALVNLANPGRPLYSSRQDYRWPLPQEGNEPRIDPDKLIYWGLDRLILERAKMRQIIENTAAKVEAARLENAAAASFFENQLADFEKSLIKRTAELHRKLALSFACLCFAVLGIPLGVASRRSALASGMIGLSIATGYYLVVNTLHGTVRDGHLDWWVLWVPNLVLLLMGAALWRRLRYSE